MLGAIIGDIAGSRFEWDNNRNKEFEFFHEECMPTDDSLMTIAVGNALIMSTSMDGGISPDQLERNTIWSMRDFGRHYPDCGYGGHFYDWIYSDDMGSYGSYGNGAAMRVSPCGEIATTLEEALEYARIVTGVTHDHPEGIKGAEATTAAVFLARHGSSMQEIHRYIEENYYHLDFTLDEIRDSYEFNETCQDTVPQALEAFFESRGFEDAIRNAISIGGDSDTLAAITGSVAEAYYGIPGWMTDQTMRYLNQYQRESVFEWYTCGMIRKGRENSR